MGEGGSRSEPGEGFFVENRPHPAFGHLLPEGEELDSTRGTKATTEHDPARPDMVLFNGGFFASAVLRDRLLKVLGSWFNRPEATQRWEPLLLSNDRLDLAVARGAAYYGVVRRGVGVRIAAGLARTYYVGIGSSASESGQDKIEKQENPASAPAANCVAPAAMCVAPAGVEEGATIDLSERRFRLLVQQPVEFPLFVSSTRLTDRAGEIVPIDPEQMTALPPIRTVLQASKKNEPSATLDVQLHARLTEIGTLELWCSQIDGPRTWRLQFDVRAATRTDLTGHSGLAERRGIVDDTLVARCRELIVQTYAVDMPVETGKGKTVSQSKPDTNAAESLMKRLAEAADMSREDWPPSLLRALWEATADVEPGRRRSAQHEARWLHLLGFCLRPGYGMALDDWRVAQTWRMMQKKLQFASPSCRAEWWILWRRVAGGLPMGQQKSLADPLLAELRAHQKALAKGRGGDFKPGAHEAAEMWRALGSFELLGTSTKADLGQLALDFATRETTASVRNAQVWALGRLGARQPAYGPLNVTIPPDLAGRWILKLFESSIAADSTALALMQLARRTGDRYRDVSESIRDRALGWLEQHSAPEHWLQLVRDGGELAEAEEGLIFGEALPHGLHVA
jgi:hypothetical protein